MSKCEHTAGDLYDCHQASELDPAVVPLLQLEAFTGSRRQEVTAGDAVVKDALRAALECGFMNLVGHGVPESLTANCVTAARSFFQQDIETKLRCAAKSATSNGYSIRGQSAYQVNAGPSEVHFKEIFDMGAPAIAGRSPSDPNVYPDEPREFRALLESYFLEMLRLERLLFEIFSLALGRAVGRDVGKDFLSRKTGRHGGRLRVNYYPRLDSPPPLGAYRDGAHTDWGTFTLLLAEKQGLEVMQGGVWRHVPSTPGTLFVNIGEQLTRWSNGRFVPTEHRVNADQCLGSSRISMAFFSTETVDPNDESVITPLCSAGEEARFESVEIRDYVRTRFEGLRK